MQKGIQSSWTTATGTIDGGNNSSKEGFCIASLVLGIVGFLINPIYVVSILAIIFGAIGLKEAEPNGNRAKTGLILGVIAICVQIFMDIILTLFTAGIGGVSFCC